MGINAFTSLGKTVKLVAASTAPTPVQVPSTTLGGNQYRVIKPVKQHGLLDSLCAGFCRCNHQLRDSYWRWCE
jgi:hypothetical protein